jgi:hypothetical protein
LIQAACAKSLHTPKRARKFPWCVIHLSVLARRQEKKYEIYVVFLFDLAAGSLYIEYCLVRSMLHPSRWIRVAEGLHGEANTAAE